ncbi:MAG: hypothetical protein AABW83_03420 [Nanoarchaeota archaeon]
MKNRLITNLENFQIDNNSFKVISISLENIINEDSINHLRDEILTYLSTENDLEYKPEFSDSMLIIY